MRDHFAAFRKQREAPPIPADDLSVSASHRLPRGNAYSQPGPAAVDLEERAAMAAEGGVAALYVDAWARMQVVHPIRLGREEWARLVDDAGLFLDAWGEAAVGLRWSADDIFGEGGLIAAMRGSAVSTLSADAATLSDGRMHRRRI